MQALNKHFWNILTYLHITHPDYKSARCIHLVKKNNFMKNTKSCDYKSECKYRHIKLKHNQQICYTCGKRTQTIKELMAHIKDVHGSQPCTKYAKGQCDRGRKCWYNHRKTNIHLNQSPPTARLEGFQKVISVPYPQIQVRKLSEEGQRQIVVQESQKKVTQMMPALVKQILELISGNQTPQ